MPSASVAYVGGGLLYSCSEVRTCWNLAPRAAWLPLLSVLWWKFGHGVMSCWWFIRKTPMHGFDCVWVRSILAAVSFTVRRVVVYDLLVSWLHQWGMLVLHSISRTWRPLWCSPA